jgi:hypothetical protein
MGTRMTHTEPSTRHRTAAVLRIECSKVILQEIVPPARVIPNARAGSSLA